MSTFQVPARRVTIRPHDNADALELAQVDDYVSIVRKGEFQTGDLAIYIPEAAIVPERILRAMNLWKVEEKTDKKTGDTQVVEKGALAGPDGNRVKAIRLRGVLSQGLLYRPNGELPGDLVEGQDYGEALGIFKWVPPIPSSLAGDVEPCSEIRSYTDIENLKRFPGVLQDGEPVIATEKTHSTCSIFSLIDGVFYVSSKGLAGKGLVIKRDEFPDGRTKNSYWRMAERYDVPAKLTQIAELVAGGVGGAEVTLFGETYGDVQDLKYGLKKGELEFKAFDIRVNGRYLDFDRFAEICDQLDIPRMPVLYRGPFDRAKIEEVSTGREQVSGTESGIREGVVVKPEIERYDEVLGRVILKSISPDYLTRKGDATEYE